MLAQASAGGWLLLIRWAMMRSCARSRLATDQHTPMLGARAPGATRTSLGAHHRHLARGRAAIGSCDWATAASPAATTTSCQQRLGIITASSTTTQSHGRERAVHRAKHGLAGSSPFSTASSSSSPAARLVCASSLTSHLSSLSAASSAPARPRVAGSPRPGTRRSLHTSPLAAARAGWQHRASTSSDSGAKTLYDELGLGERAQKSEIKARFYEVRAVLLHSVTLVEKADASSTALEDLPP